MQLCRSARTYDAISDRTEKVREFCTPLKATARYGTPSHLAVIYPIYKR